MDPADGIEGRVPFLGKTMVSLGLAIPSRLKLYRDRQGNCVWEKWVLRKAFEDLLPPEILWRDKEQFDEERVKIASAQGRKVVMAMKEATRNQALWDFACRYIPGGVNTQIRNFGLPLVFVRAQGARIWDADGKEYLDYHAAFGPTILGHCDPEVNRRVFEILEQIDLIGVGTTELEAKVAEKIVRHVPSAEKALFCNSGAEATYAAVRLARAVTGRKKIVKFQGCYHDYLAMNVINTTEQLQGFTCGPYPKVPLSAGSLPEALEQTVVLTFNSMDEVEEVFRRNGHEIAAVILEPIPHNIGCVMPKPEFLQALRDITRLYDALLIFDEVITGFRHDIGGYQKICGVTPDLTTLGKAMANGYPCAAICGRADLMDWFGTAGGSVFFAGTYNAHPVGMAAALATIERLESGQVHRHLFSLGEEMRKGLQEIVERLGIKATVAGFGSVFLLYFMEPPVENYHDLLRNDAEAFVEHRRRLLSHGIFMLPMNLKRNHLSFAHTKADVERTLDAVETVLKEMRREGKLR